MGGSGKQLVRRGSLEVLGESRVTGRRPTGRVASSVDVSAAFGALWPQSGGTPASSVSTPCPSSPTTRASHTSWTRCVGGPTAFLPEPGLTDAVWLSVVSDRHSGYGAQRRERCAPEAGLGPGLAGREPQTHRHGPLAQHQRLRPEQVKPRPGSRQQGPSARLWRACPPAAPGPKRALHTLQHERQRRGRQPTTVSGRDPGGQEDWQDLGRRPRGQGAAPTVAQPRERGARGRSDDRWGSTAAAATSPPGPTAAAARSKAGRGWQQGVSGGAAEGRQEEAAIL